MLYLASDHGGFHLKEKVKSRLAQQKVPFIDCGAFAYDKDDDYPDFIIPLAKKIGKSPTRHKGIIFGRSGQGEAIAANKIKGVRAALYYGKEPKIIRLSRTHNNCNVLSLGGDFVTPAQAMYAIMLWLHTSFSQVARHKRRIKKIG